MGNIGELHKTIKRQCRQWSAQRVSGGSGAEAGMATAAGNYARAVADSEVQTLMNRPIAFASGLVMTSC